MTKIYQIYYDDESMGKLDPAFIPYDNRHSIRKDWYEFSVIKSLLENNNFDDNDYFGVLSARFFEKTNIKGADVLEIVQQANSEIISFSPVFFQIALYQNCFFQAENYHPGITTVADKLFKTVGLDTDLRNWWADRTRTIYSNYFVAKIRFWRIWLGYANKIYDICELNQKGLGRYLSIKTNHRGVDDVYEFKVFIMERMVNVLLEKFNISAQIGSRYESAENFDWVKKQLLVLDALKSQYLKTRDQVYLELYHSKIRSIDFRFGLYLHKLKGYRNLEPFYELPSKK